MKNKCVEIFHFNKYFRSCNTEITIPKNPLLLNGLRPTTCSPCAFKSRHIDSACNFFRDRVPPTQPSLSNSVLLTALTALKNLICGFNLCLFGNHPNTRGFKFRYVQIFIHFLNKYFYFAKCRHFKY